MSDGQLSSDSSRLHFARFTGSNKTSDTWILQFDRRPIFELYPLDYYLLARGTRFLTYVGKELPGLTSLEYIGEELPGPRENLHF